MSRFVMIFSELQDMVLLQESEKVNISKEIMQNLKLSLTNR